MFLRIFNVQKPPDSDPWAGEFRRDNCIELQTDGSPKIRS